MREKSETFRSTQYGRIEGFCCNFAIAYICLTLAWSICLHDITCNIAPYTPLAFHFFRFSPFSFVFVFPVFFGFYSSLAFHWTLFMSKSFPENVQGVAILQYDGWMIWFSMQLPLQLDVDNLCTVNFLNTEIVWTRVVLNKRGVCLSESSVTVKCATEVWKWPTLVSSLEEASVYRESSSHHASVLTQKPLRELPHLEHELCTFQFLSCCQSLHF